MTKKKKKNLLKFRDKNKLLVKFRDQNNILPMNYIKMGQHTLTWLIINILISCWPTWLASMWIDSLLFVSR